MKRGEVYYCNLPYEGGHTQSYYRPVVIVSNDIGNHHSPIVIVVPITKAYKKPLPTHVNIRLGNGSTVLAEQIFTVDKSRLQTHIYNLSKSEIHNLDKALKVSLELVGGGLCG